MKLAVLGDPVAHSRSPFLHGGFLREAGIAGTYEAIRVGVGTLAARLPELRAAGFSGFNVTTPLKEEAYALCARADAAATFARAANTLWFDGAGVAGANTDGAGAVAAIAAALAPPGDRRPPLAGRSILLLGAGPTARAAAHAFARAGVRLFVWSRRAEPARDLVAGLALAGESDGAEIFVFDLRRSRTTRVDEPPWPPAGRIEAILSTLPPDAAVPPPLRSLLAFVPCVVDANYGARATLGASLGRSDVATGETMLEAQGRASFALWRAASGR